MILDDHYTTLRPSISIMSANKRNLSQSRHISGLFVKVQGLKQQITAYRGLSTAITSLLLRKVQDIAEA